MQGGRTRPRVTTGRAEGGDSVGGANRKGFRQGRGQEGGFQRRGHFPTLFDCEAGTPFPSSLNFLSSKMGLIIPP